MLEDGGVKADVDIKDEAAETLFTRYSFSTWFGRCHRCGVDEILKVPCEADLIVISSLGICLARRALLPPGFLSILVKNVIYGVLILSVWSEMIKNIFRRNKVQKS